MSSSGGFVRHLTVAVRVPNEAISKLDVDALQLIPGISSLSVRQIDEFESRVLISGTDEPAVKKIELTILSINQPKNQANIPKPHEKSVKSSSKQQVNSSNPVSVTSSGRSSPDDQSVKSANKKSKSNKHSKKQSNNQPNDQSPKPSKQTSPSASAKSQSSSSNQTNEQVNKQANTQSNDHSSKRAASPSTSSQSSSQPSSSAIKNQPVDQSNNQSRRQPTKRVSIHEPVRSKSPEPSTNRQTAKQPVSRSQTHKPNRSQSSKRSSSQSITETISQLASHVNSQPIERIAPSDQAAVPFIQPFNQLKDVHRGTVRVPRSAMSFIIGPGGSTIARMRSRPNIIDVQTVDVGSDETDVTIVGTELAAVIDSKVFVNQSVRAAAAKKGDKSKRHSMGSITQGSINQSANQSEQSSKHVETSQSVEAEPARTPKKAADNQTSNQSNNQATSQTNKKQQKMSNNRSANSPQHQKQSVDQSNKQPIDQAIKQSENQTIESKVQPASQVVEQAVPAVSDSASNNQSAQHSHNQSDSQKTKQPKNQSNKQSHNQSNNPANNQSNKSFSLSIPIPSTSISFIRGRNDYQLSSLRAMPGIKKVLIQINAADPSKAAVLIEGSDDESRVVVEQVIHSSLANAIENPGMSGTGSPRADSERRTKSQKSSRRSTSNQPLTTSINQSINQPSPVHNRTIDESKQANEQPASSNHQSIKSIESVAEHDNNQSRQQVDATSQSNIEPSTHLHNQTSTHAQQIDQSIVQPTEQSVDQSVNKSNGSINQSNDQSASQSNDQSVNQLNDHSINHSASQIEQPMFTPVKQKHEEHKTADTPVIVLESFDEFPSLQDSAKKSNKKRQSHAH